jgi:hypothetical protein
MEHIPFIHDLFTRLHDDFIFRLDCGFLVSNDVPSHLTLPANGGDGNNKKTTPC